MALIPCMNLQAFELLGVRWNTTVYWRVQDDAPAFVRESVLHSIEQYTAVSEIKFEEVCSGENLLIRYEKDLVPFDYLGVTGFTANSDGFITKATIIINANKIYAETLKKRQLRQYKRFRIYHYYLKTLMLHEMGHAVGVNHNELPESIMSPSIPSGIFKKFSADDIIGIQALYGSKK